MDQLNQVAQNMVKILSDWKDENDKYKANIDQFQTGLDAQAATLQNFINSNLAMQSSATKNGGKESGKRALAQTSNQNETDAAPSKRLKKNDAESTTTRKLPDNFFAPCLISIYYYFLLLKLDSISIR